jgi:hypothetical protein
MGKSIALALFYTLCPCKLVEVAHITGVVCVRINKDENSAGIMDRYLLKYRLGLHAIA